jgi:hypothetical protein
MRKIFAILALMLISPIPEARAVAGGGAFMPPDSFSSIPESKLYGKIKSLLRKIKQKPKIVLIQQFVLRG